VRLRDRAGATVALTFDNLGEVTALERGEWPADAPVGEHWSVTRALPRILDALAEADVQATFFVEGLNAELYPATERELLERGVEAFDALGLRPVSFRPPGGDLTPGSPALLRELGFRYVSPAGDEVIEDELTVLPFRWELVDAWYYLPKFAGPPSADALRGAVRRALDAGGYVPLLFHPFLTDSEERFAVFREALEAIAH
jgi:peptidoglycan/xylan/chitin deacetylase (PgdA/CDA1 family)